ncbi:MAG: lysophospholipid acyltransferase family protein [Candidatus Acidiferrales bacterium]
MIRLFFASLYMFFLVLVVGPPFILHAYFTRDAGLLYRTGMGALMWLYRLLGIRIRVEGLENIPPSVCVFMANHTSNVDPPAIVHAIPRRIALLAKKELFQIPIVGAALTVANIVPVDRKDRDAAVASVERAVAHLKAGVSFLVYPEGTRSRDGRLLPFKKGTFVMAIQAGVPIVPVSVANAHRIMRKGKWAIHPGEIIVRFGRPIDASAYTIEQRSELLDVVHAAVAEGLPADQQPASGAEAA